MTSLKEQLKADLTVHLKARDELETLTLRNLLGAIQTQEKSGKSAVEFGDAQILTLLAQEVKKRRATAPEYIAGGRPDRAERELAEADFISKYLPAGLTDAEVEAIVDSAIATVDATGPQAFGQVMKIVSPQTKGRADGKVVSDLVKSKLART